MKKIFILVIIIFVIVLSSCKPTDPTDPPIDDTKPDFETEHIEIFFTKPYSDPTLDDALIELIDSTTSNSMLDICFYGLNRDNVISAIENAIERGVHIRFVGNKSGSNTVNAAEGDYYEGYKRIALALDSKFPVDGKKRVEFPNDTGFDDFILMNGSATMHNKFVLATDSEGNEYLYTGTTNCTDTGFERNNNNSLIIQDSGIVSIYQQQFEYLLELLDSTEVSSVNTYTIDGIEIDVLFSPNMLGTNNAMDELIDLVTLADDSIHFMIFSFPYMDLNDLMLEKFNAGVDVKGVFDKSQLNNSAEEYFAQRGMPVRIDGNEHELDFHGGKLHHKTMILDSGQSDAVVVTGSFNWSNNATENNDENMLFIHSQEIAQLYEVEWKARWDEGTEVPTVTPGDDANYQDIIINEVMWMGSTVWSDEFIELKNLTSQQIDLSGWFIHGGSMSGKPLLIPEGAYILPNEYLVIMTKYLSDSAFQPNHRLTIEDLSISNDKVKLILMDQNGTHIDYAGNGSAGDDFAGYNGTAGDLEKSMARNEIFNDGTVASNWFTSSTQANISTENDYSLYVYATPDEDNDYGIINYQALDVVISEVAWAGTDTSFADEWIELYNNTTEDITLVGWTLSDTTTSLVIDLSGTIPAGKHFLLEKTDDDTVPGTLADQIYTGDYLGNGGGSLTLTYDASTIDAVDCSGDWFAGSSSPKLSMERVDTTSDGDSTNWQDGSGDIEGAENSTM